MSVCLQNVRRFALIVFELLMLESQVLLNLMLVFARPFLGDIFLNFCIVIWFYEMKLEVEVDFCMFLVVYMFSKLNLY